MFDSLKNTINNTVQSVTKQLVAPPTQSQFLERGTLTPAEFIEVRHPFTDYIGRQQDDQCVWVMEMVTCGGPKVFFSVPAQG
jgi:hypothetical protein